MLRAPSFLPLSPHLADPDFLASHQPCIFSGLEVPWREPWLKILFAAPRPLLERLEQQAEESGVSEGTERVYTCPTYLEFLPQGVHKGRCLGDLRCLDVFRQRRMIAIGDYSNDVELLQEADIAVAVDNALPEVKAVADYCTVSHNDSAIAHLIANILPESEPRRPGLPFRSSLEQNLAKGVQDAPPVVSRFRVGWNRTACRIAAHKPEYRKGEGAISRTVFRNRLRCKPSLPAPRRLVLFSAGQQLPIISKFIGGSL